MSNTKLWLALLGMVIGFMSFAVFVALLPPVISERQFIWFIVGAVMNLSGWGLFWCQISPTGRNRIP